MTSLSTLTLDATAVGNAGIAALARLPRLHDLALQATEVDDAALPSFSRMPLRRIDLRHTRVTRAGATRLQRRLQCDVQWGGRPLKRGEIWMR
jgi:hypothetical protein